MRNGGLYFGKGDYKQLYFTAVARHTRQQIFNLYFGAFACVWRRGKMYGGQPYAPFCHKVGGNRAVNSARNQHGGVARASAGKSARTGGTVFSYKRAAVAYFDRNRNVGVMHVNLKVIKGR